MKVYLSVDIEGITGVTNWNETILGHNEHKWAAEQMMQETIAACKGAESAGAKEIIIKDAHDSGRNIDLTELPENSILIKGWTSSPESMVAGINESFDACVFIGYHSGNGSDGNPLSHTFDNEKIVYLKVNGELASEFTLNTYLAAYYGVPVVFLSGDKELCNQAKELVPNLETVAVKECEGGATFNINSELACRNIKEGVEKGLLNIEKCKIESPKEFHVEIRYVEHKDAHRASYYPGVSKVDGYTIEYTAKNIFELMTTRMFIL